MDAQLNSAFKEETGVALPSLHPIKTLSWPLMIERMKKDLFDPTPIAPWCRPDKKQVASTLPHSTTIGLPPLKKPKRPCTAYNFFFHSERLSLVGCNGKGIIGKGRRKNKVGFAEMARIIAGRWKRADRAAKAPFCLKANLDKIRYHREKEEYDNEMARRRERERSIEYNKIRLAQPSRQDPMIANLAQRLDKETKDMIVYFFA